MHAEVEVTLIAHEIGPKATEQLLARPSCGEELAGNDVAAFVFDSSSPESFREAHLTLMRVAEASGNSLPCVFLAAKDDLAMPHVSRLHFMRREDVILIWLRFGLVTAW